MKKFFKSVYTAIPFKKQVFHFLRIFKLPKSIYQHLHFKGVFKVKFGNYSFLIEHHGYQIENEIFWSGLTGGWEKISMQLWIALCKNSNSILDIGANTGIYSLVAKSINPASNVYAFEPVDRVFEKLVTNDHLNSFDIKNYKFAFSNYDGVAIIYDTSSEHVYSVTVNKNTSDNPNVIEQKISVKKLSTWIRETGIKNIDLIKLDVETHEPEVLEGMEDYLQKFQPTLLIEVLSDEFGAKIQEKIKNINYLYFNIDEMGKPKRVKDIVKSDYYNYLICKPEIALILNLIEN
jgi:FkbM family methyltransferase